jgi:hypothetical protein
MNHLKFIILIGILSLMALFYIFGESSEVEGQIDKEALAPEIKGWSFVNDIEVDYKIYSALDPNTLIFRNYANNHNQLVNLVVVYHQNDRWGAHDPTVCYRSQGWQIVEKPHDIRISNGKLDVAVKRFVVTKGQVSSLVHQRPGVEPGLLLLVQLKEKTHSQQKSSDVGHGSEWTYTRVYGKRVFKVFHNPRYAKSKRHHQRFERFYLELHRGIFESRFVIVNK